MHPPIFGGLVIGCIAADFCEKIVFFKLSPRSTRYTPFYRSQNSKFQQKKLEKFCKNFVIFAKIQNFSQIFKKCKKFKAEKMHFLMKSARYTCGTTKKCKFSEISANFCRFDPLKIRGAADFEGVRGGPCTSTWKFVPT